MSLDSKREGGRVKLVRYFRPFFAFFLMPALAPCTAGAATLDVPGDYSDIQSALDGANDGDVVRVAPGTWDVDLTFGGGKSVTLASHFIDSGDEGFIASTILDGFARTQVVTVHSSAGPDTVSWTQWQSFASKTLRAMSCGTTGILKIVMSFLPNCRIS